MPRVSRVPGSSQRAAAYGFFQRQDHFARVQHIRIPSLGGLGFPAIGGVQRLQQQALVRGARHDAGGVEYALVGHSPEPDRRLRGVFHAHCDRFEAVRQLHPLDLRDQRRLEPLKLLCEILQRVVGNLLPHHFAAGCHAKHDLTAMRISKRAQRAAGAIFFRRRFLEFKRQGFACGDQVV